MKTLKRSISIFLTLTMIVSILPVYALDMDELNALKTDEELRLAVRGDEKWTENYPSGLFNFIQGNLTVNESQDFLEFAVVRQGGTQGEVSVDFKVVDVSAKYGEDYVIKVLDGAGAKATIKEDKASAPLIETLGKSSEINISAKEGEEDNTAADAAVSDYKEEETSEEADAVTDSAATEPAKAEKSEGEYSALDLISESTEADSKSSKLSLRQAKEQYTGVKSDRPDWKEIDKGSVESLKESYDETLGALPGAKATLTFGDGEFIKYLRLVPKNDKISESDEQSMLMLENPIGDACRGEFYMSTVTIKDDEEAEKSIFEIETGSVMATDGKAAVVVRRTGGVQRYASVYIGTEEGTAAADADYVPGLSELFFTPGMEKQTVCVDVLPNKYRTGDRQFTISLDRTNENVNLEKAECIVTIPATEDAKTPDQMNMLFSRGFIGEFENENAQFSLLDVDISSIEKISANGRSDIKGNWLLTANDFINGGNRSGGFSSGENLRFSHTGGGQWAHATASSGVKLYGVSSVEFGYSNVGSGRQEAYQVTVGSGCNKHQETRYRTVHDMHFDFEIDAPGCTRAVKKFDAQASGKASATLSQSQWNNNWIGFYSHVDNGATNTNITINPVRLILKQYNAKALAADNLQKTTYEILNTNLSSKSNVSYSPGSIALKEVLSNVGNGQGVNTSRTEASVYRSDIINLEVKYSPDNPNGKYAYYDGFAIKNGNNWIEYRSGTTTLDLCISFFRESGMLSAISSGNIEIKPIFVPRNAKLKTSFNATTGYIEGLGIANPNKEFGGNLHVGDKVNLSAKPNSVSMTPSWSAETGANINGTGLVSNGSVITVTETAGNTKTTVALENVYTALTVAFINPTLTVRANPNVYGVRVTNPSYSVNNVKYTSQEALTEKMQDVFNNGQNPDITMNFDCYFEPGSIGDAKKAMFGNPTTAVVIIYKSDGTIRSTKQLTYNRGFTLSGKLQELGWELDDVATVIIYGSAKIGTQTASTRETVVDFLSNTQNAVIVKSPDGSLKDGDISKIVTVSNALPTEAYRLDAYTTNNFVAKWSDYSVDLNNNGNEEQEEKEAALVRLRALGYSGTLDDARDLTVYYGNSFFVKPMFFDPTKIFYNFEKKTAETAKYDVGLKLIQKGGTILDPNIPMVPRPIKNAAVIIVNKQIQYDAENDLYYDSDPLYQERTNYLGKVFLSPYEYFFKVTSGTVEEVSINASEIMPPVDFKVKMPDNSYVDFITVTNGAKTRTVDIKGGNTEFSYKFNNTKTGITPNTSIIRIYDGDEVKYTYNTDAPDLSGKFTYNLDLLAGGIKPGYTMSIAGVFETTIDGVTKRQEFPEVHAGFTFRKTLTALSVAASFKTPIAPTLKLFGKINNAYDLGADVEIDKYLTPSQYTDTNGMDRKIKTISFGFSKSFEKKITDSTKVSTSPSPSQSASPSSSPEPSSSASPSSSPAPSSSASPSASPEASPGTSPSSSPGTNFVKDMFNKVTGYDSIVKEVKDAQDTAKSAKRGSGEGAATLNFSISLAIILEEGQKISPITGTYVPDGYDYFSSLVLTATADATFSYTYTYVTPIGIPVMASINASGSALAAFGMEADHRTPYAEKYRFDGEQSISFNPTNYSTYVSFQVKPRIELGAGVGFSFLNLMIYGGAEFDFAFFVPIYGSNNASSGSGGVVFDASLSIKILFIQKRWTLYKSDRISLFGYGQNSSVANLMSNPYQDYMYQTVDELSESDVMPRDYLSAQSGWLGETYTPRRGGRLMSSLMAIEDGGEKELQTSAYPYPQTKVVKLNDTKTMLLFITDDTSRDGRNRAVLKYSIGEGDNWSDLVTVADDDNWSDPVTVADDGTWDESPDAFIIDGKVLITWSDASRKFTEQDGTMDTMKAMDISAKWYNIETGALDAQETQITMTTEDEHFSDTMPMISYDEEEKRLLIYYTKIDFEDDQGDRQQTVNLSDDDTVKQDELPKEDKDLYGDIINGYNVIAYRYADKLDDGSFLWNDNYDGEDVDPEFADQFYGQRLLDLAVPATITETVESKDNPIVVNQTVQYNESNPTDPRVIDSDLISYNGLAIYAYTVDLDANLKTINDRKLFAQIYNFSEDSFSYPIMLTVNSGYITSPKFVRSKGITYLYWLSDGDIVYADMSNMIKSGLTEATIDGTGNKIYILNKINKNVDAYEKIAVRQEKDNPIGEFMIRSNDEGIYMIWPQTVISYKNGLKAGDPGTEKPDNIVKEKQIFAAFCEPQDSIKEWVVTAADDDFPNDMPQGLIDSFRTELSDLGKTRADFVGKTIKYNSTDTGYNWSKPVQVTFDNGANFGDISFTVDNDNSLMLSYIKYTHKLEKDIFVEDPDNRTLAVRNIKIESTPEISDIKLLSENAPIAGETVSAQISILNTGVLPIEQAEYQTYIISGGEEQYTSEWKNIISQKGEDVILGGSTVSITDAFDMPDDISDIKIGYRFNSALNNAVYEKEIEAKSKMDVSVNSISQLSKEKAAINLTAVNIGNLPFDEDLTVKTGETVLYEEKAVLAVGEQKDFNITFDISEEMFGDVVENEDGSVQDSIPLTIAFGSSEVSGSIVRKADKKLIDKFFNLKSIDLKFNGETANNSIELLRDEPGELKASPVYYTALKQGESDLVELLYSSSDSKVVTVLGDGTIVPMDVGEAVISVTAVPVNNTLISNTDSFKQGDVFLPKGFSLVKEISVSIRKEESEPQHDNGGGSKRKHYPPVVSVLPIRTIQYAVKEGENEENLVVYEIGANGERILVKKSYYDKETQSMVFSGTKDGQYEIVNNAVNFSDTQGHWANSYIMYTAARNIFNGTGADEFSPDLPVTRGMFITVLGRLENITGNSEQIFTDVPSDAYYAPYINWAAQNGIAKGVGNSMFDPEAEMTREQIAVVLSNFLSYTGKYPAQQNEYSEYADNGDINGWASDAVTRLSRIGLMQGKEDNLFAPQASLTRAEAATVTSRLIKMLFK